MPLNISKPKKTIVKLLLEWDCGDWTDVYPISTDLKSYEEYLEQSDLATANLKIVGIRVEEV